MANTGVKITMNSADFQSKMKIMVKEMQNLSSEFSVAQAQAKLLGNASDILKSKIAEATAKIELQKNIVKANEEQHERLTANLDKERKKHESLTKELSEAKDAYKKTADQTGQNSDESKELAKQVEELEKKLGTCTQSVEKQQSQLLTHETKTNKSKAALYDMELQLKDLNTELKQTQLDEFSKDEEKAADGAKEFAENADKAAESAEKFAKGIEKFASGADKVAEVTDKVGRKMTVVSGAITAAGTGAVKSAIEFESAFTGVKKTVDGTEEQFEMLKQGIMDMSKELPSSTTEIASVAEAAGQLGIKTDDILSFTRVMIDLGEATNLTADEAASALAKFANVVNMDAENYDRLGSVIVALGNNFATTEADIVSMATRLASTGAIVGLSESQTMAIATALLSVGIEAEAGGSAISKLLKIMEVFVQTYGTAKQTIDATGYSLRDLELMSSLNSKGFKEVAGSLGLTTAELNGYMSSASSLEQFADVSGLSSDQFIENWGTDAVGALSMFIGGLNDTERTGKSAVELLNDMGLTEIRLSNAVLSLASSDGILTDALDVSNAAWGENIALSNESEQRYATTESRIAMMKNNISALAVSFGEILLPYVESTITKISELIDKFNGLSDGEQQTIIKIAAVIAAIGPGLIAFSKLASSVGTVASVIGKLSGAMAGTGGLSGVLSAVCSPVGLVIAAIVALVAGLGYVIATNEDVRNSLLSVIGDLKSSIQPALEFISNTVIPNLQEAWKRLQEMLAPLADFLIGAFTSCWTDFLIPAIEWITYTVVPTLTSTFENLWNNVIVPFAAFLDSVFTPVISIVSEYMTMLWNNVIVPLAQFLGGVFAAAWEGMAKIYNETVVPIINKVISIFQFLWTGVLQPVVEWLWNFLKPIFQNVFEFIGGLFETLKEVFKGVIDFIFGIFTLDWSQAWEGIKKIFSGIWDSVILFIQYICKQMQSLFSGIWNKIKDIFSSVGSWFTDIFNDAWSGIKNAFSSAGSFFSNVWEGIKAPFKSVASWFKDIFSKAWTGVKNVFSSGGKIFDGIKDGIANVFTSIVNKIIKGINKVVSVPFNGINSALQAIKDVSIAGITPFDWISTITVPEIPLLAKGGVLSKPRLIMAGEDGAEAIVPLEKNTGWIDILCRKLESMFLKAARSLPSVSLEWYKEGSVISDETYHPFSQKAISGEGITYVALHEAFYERLAAILDSKYEKLKEKQIISVTAISTLDGEVVAEHTTEMVVDNIVKEIQSRR